MSKNAPTPSNAVSFSEKNREHWLGMVLTDNRFSKSDVLIAAILAQNIEFQNGYGGWIMNSSYKYVVNTLKNEKIVVDRADVATVLKSLLEYGYLSKFKLNQAGLYYFTDPTK